MKKFIRRLLFPDTCDSETYIKALRNKYHIDIGEHCVIWSPNKVYIDTQRPHLLHIGNYVKITSGVNIVCHDYSRSVFMNMEGYGNVGEARETWIGNNVFIGMNTTILMGTRIGDNSIIGAGSVVSGEFVGNSVLAGNLAKKICTLDEFYTKRKRKEVENAKLYVNKWKAKYGSNPTLKEMSNAFAWLYLPHTIETIKKYPGLFNYSGVNDEVVKANFLMSKPIFESFEEFLYYCENN